MANKVETLVASAAIKCPADKFYNFFKLDTNEIVKIFPAAFTGVELIEGEEGAVGSIKIWHYIIGNKCHYISILKFNHTTIFWLILYTLSVIIDDTLANGTRF